MKSLLFACLSMLLLLACVQPAPKMDLEKEKKAIREVIGRETESYYQQDFAAWKSCFVDSAYFRSHCFWDGWPEKVRVYNGFDTLELIKKDQFKQDKTIWKGSTEERLNENFRISSDMAWYTFDQLSYENGTRKFLGRSVETRILEKHAGQWKIAYLGYHYFPDTTVKAE